MSAAAPPALPKFTRCRWHAERAAVARCQSCGGMFCRECVTEHDLRMVCSDCLAKEAKAAVEAGKPKRRLAAPLWIGAQLLAGIVVLWLMYYFLGRLLLSVPGDFHDLDLVDGEGARARFAGTSQALMETPLQGGHECSGASMTAALVSSSDVRITPTPTPQNNRARFAGTSEALMETPLQGGHECSGASMTAALVSSSDVRITCTPTPRSNRVRFAGTSQALMETPLQGGDAV